MKKIIFSLITLLISQSVFAEFKIPKYQSLTLKNGLQVYLMQQNEVPLIDIRLTIKAGAINDKKQYGLASLTGDSLLFGSSKLSKTEIEDLLAFYGAELNSITDSEMSTLSLSIAAKDQQKLLALFADVALHPSFDKTEFDKFKKRFINQLKQQRESPNSIIGNLFNKMYYGDHPYGNPVGGDETTVETIELADLKSFYKSYYTPSNSALVIVGDFEPSAMKNQVEQLFGGWQGGKLESKVLPLVVDKNQANIWLVNKDDAIETTFVIGGKGISSDHPDYIASQVINTILGGRFTSWLNDELRVNSGLTYGARSRFEDNSKSGSFIISTFTKKETTFEALDLALKTYQKLWEKGIDQATLDSAKAYVKGQFPPRYETSGQLASLLSRMWALNLDASLINEFEEKVDSLNVVKANQLVKSLFPSEHLQIVMIGKAADIKEKAKKYGELKEMEIKTFTY